MDRILIILKKENGPRASSAPALGLNTIIFKYVYWYMKQISGERLQDHWSSGYVHLLNRERGKGQRLSDVTRCLLLSVLYIFVTSLTYVSELFHIGSLESIETDRETCYNEVIYYRHIAK